MSGDIEKAQQASPALGGSGDIIYVNAAGEATGEIEHLKQVHLEVEQLSDANTSIIIDMRKIAADGYSGLDGIQVMLLDFGIPARSVAIRGDFQTSAEVRNSGYDTENDSSPNTLEICAPRTKYDTNTFDFDIDERSGDYGYALRRGNSLYLAHDGKSISTRTGFLDEFDQLGITKSGAWGHYEDLLKLSYEGHGLTIEVLNHSQALVAFGKSVGFAERHEVTQDIPTEVRALLEGIEDEVTREAVLGLHGRLAQLAVEHEVTLGEIETLEALLAHNKGLLSTEKMRVWELRAEIERLKAQGGGQAAGDSDWLRDMFGGKSGSQSAIERHCETIGLNPQLLKAKPEIALNAAKALRKVWAKQLHSDTTGSGEDEETLKGINAAIDAIVDYFS